MIVAEELLELLILLLEPCILLPELVDARHLGQQELGLLLCNKKLPLMILTFKTNTWFLAARTTIIQLKFHTIH